MAEQEGEGVDVAEGNGADQQPQLAILAQYVKDLSFENPNAPQVFQSTAQPQLDVNVNVGVTRPGDDVYEVALKINVTAKVEGATSFAVELLYNGLFGLRHVPEEALQPFLLVEAPRILFPFARRVISDVTRDGGFAPLMLEPIDFASLYLAQVNGDEGQVGNA
jgi:preprotein translocase subunit SecB